ncbi:ATP-binding protein [Rhizobium laguerreae]|nr:ATP-binding protein [Rhizobium laguerreae]
MTTDELESLLEGAEETDVLELKGAMPWDIGLAKDILAMANLQDGGRIVIGIEDITYARQGLDEAQLATYKSDEMRDQVAPFADPYVEFSTSVATDRQGLRYVVIAVAPFREIPVICKRSGGSKNELQEGTIYYRSPTRRPQSARVSSASDMRSIVEVAAARQMQRFRKLDLEVPTAKGFDYDAELGGL